MKVSIITVCYNAEKTIADAMESVALQRTQVKVEGEGEQRIEIEYIVVDGGSTDGTVEEIKNCELRIKNGGSEGFSFKWVSEKDRGMYDALNKGMRMATGEVIGILNADDVLAEEDTLARVASVFREQGSGFKFQVSGVRGQVSGGGGQIDGCYGDIRFVREGVEKVERVERVERVRGLRTVRYCSGKWFRPWMFRFGTQTAHPSTFFRKECFAKWGEYSLDYGMYGDFELLCRFIWKHRARMKYLPICTTVMRMGGASTNGWRTTLKINRSDLRALKANGCWSCLPLLYLRYLVKIWGFVRRRGG